MEKNDVGNWQGGGTAFLGLQLGDTPPNYGWARISYDDAANTLTLLDFAYE